MEGYQLKLPGKVYGGQGSTKYVLEILNHEKVEHLIIFTDKGIRATGLLDPILKQLEGAKKSYQIIDDIMPEPSYLEVEKAMIELEKMSGDMIIAVGGGSVMDIAKLCSVLYKAPYTVRDLLVDATIASKTIKTVMIPTTCGTGSEATCNSILAIPEEQSKKGIVNSEMISDYVILDPLMIAKLPKSIIAATGVDALAHVVECYTSKKATLLSDMYALEGARLIFKNLIKAYQQPDNLKAKEELMLGAFYGGVAISGSGTTAVHALAYPLGGKYHLAHGVSNAILLAHVMAFNKEACQEKLAHLCEMILSDSHEMSVAQKADLVIDEIAKIVRETEIPVSLKSFGITENDLDFLTEAGSQQQRLLVNNMKELSLEDIRNIYKKVII